MSTNHKAYIEVKEYDDDFLLLVNGAVIEEGTKSAAMTGATEVEALSNLLSVTKVTDRHLKLALDAPVPDCYHHVKAVRHMIAAMHAICASGKLPETHWGGNWDVTFHVGAEVPARTNNQRAERASAALKAYHDHCGDAGPHDHDEVMGDLMCDMMHLLRQQGQEDPHQVMDELLVTASNNFDAEETEES